MALGVAKLGLLVGAFALAIASVIALHPAYQPAPARMAPPADTARADTARAVSDPRPAPPVALAPLTAPPAVAGPTDHDRYRQITASALANLRLATGQATVAEAGPGVLRRLVARSLAATPPDSYTDALQAEALFGLTAAIQDETSYGEGDASNTPIIYTVQDGDSLRTIAARFYGDAAGFLAIYEANRTILVTPDRLRAGQRLVIPGT